MSIFGDIWNKITGGSETQAAAATSTQDAAAAPTPDTAAPTGATSASEVDVEATLKAIQTEKGGDENWRTSIVDLLKLLDLDSSLNARKELAQELNVHAGPDGSAEQNIALHQAVMQKMEENGGKVPDSLKG